MFSSGGWYYSVISGHASYLRLYQAKSKEVKTVIWPLKIQTVWYLSLKKQGIGGSGTSACINRNLSGIKLYLYLHPCVTFTTLPSYFQMLCKLFYT